MMAVLALSLLGTATRAPAAVAAAPSAAPTWTRLAPATHPSARSYGTMAFDAATGQLVLFGGRDVFTFADTWTWDGTTWAQLFPATSPPGLIGSTMVYDGHARRLVLFGGACIDLVCMSNDTWTWDGTNWTKQSPSTKPARRMDAGMAYDPVLQRVVLFGGYNGSGVLGDTWAWDGTTWTRVSPATSPPARSSFGQAYDPHTRQVVLFGGFDGSTELADTWTFDGTTWTQAHPPLSPACRSGARMALDPAARQVVLFGGNQCPSGSFLGDTWVWNGSRWQQLSSPTAPSPRSLFVLSRDADGHLLLFGGYKQQGPNEVSDSQTWRLA